MTLTDSPTHSVELQRATFAWQFDRGELSFFGLPSVLFWLDPSLRRMLEPLAQEIGVPLFRLLVAHSSSQGTDADYQSMITTLGATFEEGFLAWGRAVATAGWGSFELPDFQPQTGRATVLVRNPWELQMQRGQAQHWGCPFLQGKLLGIFSHALGTNCWADERIVRDDAAGSAVEFTIYPSPLTIGAEIARLREERARREQQHLAEEVARVTRRLEQALAEQQRVQEQAFKTQEALIAELSTPLIPLSDQVVLMPLIGQMDSMRAQRVIDTLLQGVAAHRATVAILDVTGLPIMDTAVANILIQAARAVRLLGAEVVLTGIRPEIAQTLVGLGLDLNDMVSRSSLQSAIAYALELSRRSQSALSSENTAVSVKRSSTRS